MDEAALADCPICLADFEAEDEIVQLKCHYTHVYHKECFKQFIEGIVKNKVGQPKCPMCQ